MSKLRNAIRETKEYLQLNCDPESNDDDAQDHLTNECGRDSSGGCSMAGTEYCDWEFPFSD